MQGAGNPVSEGHGIGASTSVLLARYGAHVVSVSNVTENCENATEAVLKEGHSASCVTTDCTDTAEVERLAESVVTDHGKVDVVINAGIHSALPVGFERLTPQTWANGIALNLQAHFNLVHSFIPHFVKQQNGNFIHYTTIASSVGLGLERQRHAYAAGKAGAATLTMRVGVEYASQGIRGNVIGIGYVTGPLVDRAVNAAGADIERVTKTRDSYVPRGYQGTPMEVAEVAAFLASDASSFINGTEIKCDGGSSGCTYGP